MKVKLIRNLNCPVSESLWMKIKEITDKEEISMAQFIRKSLNEKLRRLEDEENTIM